MMRLDSFTWTARPVSYTHLDVYKRQVIVVDYSSYINEEQCIADNAGLMCINLLKKVGVQDIVLAGFDGFSTDIKQNFYEQSMTIDVEAERLIRINAVSYTHLMCK